MLTSFSLIMMLILPGMSEPKVLHGKPLGSFEECMAQVKDAADLIKAHEGEPFKFMVGCEVTGNKADPA